VHRPRPDLLAVTCRRAFQLGVDAAAIAVALWAWGERGLLLGVVATIGAIFIGAMAERQAIRAIDPTPSSLNPTPSSLGRGGSVAGPGA
jgi:hypothetical protein